MLENVLGYLKTLVHLLEPNLTFDLIPLKYKLDPKNIIHHHQLTFANCSVPTDFEEITISNLLTLKEEQLCLECFKEVTDLILIIGSEALKDALSTITLIEQAVNKHDYVKMLSENDTYEKINSLANEYASYEEEMENHYSEMYENIPPQYLEIVEDFLVKSPIKLDMVHTLSLGSPTIKKRLEEHFQAYFTLASLNHEQVVVALEPAYNIESRYLSKVSQEEEFEDSLDSRERRQMAFTLLSVYAPKLSFVEPVATIPVWVYEVLKLTSPTSIQSKSYPSSEINRINTALKLMGTEYRSENIYRDFDLAMATAERLL